MDIGKATILVGQGPPAKKEIIPNSIFGKKGNIYFGYGPPKGQFIPEKCVVLKAETIEEPAPSKGKNKLDLLKKVRLYCKVANIVKSTDEQEKQNNANWGYIGSDDESENESLKYFSRNNSYGTDITNQSGCRLILSRNRKYNDIVTSHAIITGKLEAIDNDMEVIRGKYYNNSACLEAGVLNGLRSSPIGVLREGILADNKARVPQSLWNEYVRFGGNGNI